MAVYGSHMVIASGPITITMTPWAETPLWTRHMAGVREAERDRRQHPRRIVEAAYTGYARKTISAAEMT